MKVYLGKDRRKPLPATKQKTTRARVFLALESEFTADGMKAFLIRHQFAVVGVELEHGHVLERVKEIAPDVLILRMHRPELRQARYISQLREVPNLKMIFWISKSDLECVAQLVKDGIRGCVLRSSPRAELIEAIEAALRGDLFFSQAIQDHLGRAAIRDLHHASGLSSLTEQERRVLMLIADGLGNKQIAKALHVDRRTVETHRRRLKQKLRIDSVARLTKFALKYCLTDPE